MDDRIDGEEARAVLGLSKCRFRELRLEPWMSRLLGGSGGKVARYSRECVQSWLNAILSAAKASPLQQSAGLVPFDRACRYVLRGEEVRRLLEAVIDGGIMATVLGSHASGLKALAFARSELDAWLQDVRSAARVISVPEAAAQMGLKQEVAYHLARNGLIRCTRTLRGRRACLTTTREAIAEFQGAFVRGVEIARGRATSPKAFIALLAGKSITPVVGPAIDGCRQAFFRRSDLRPLGIASAAVRTKLPYRKP